MATGTQTQTPDQQLVEARAAYNAAKLDEDTKYTAYHTLPLSTRPEVVNAARDAYLRAYDVTVTALGAVTQALHRKYVQPKTRGIGFDSEA